MTKDTQRKGLAALFVCILASIFILSELSEWMYSFASPEWVRTLAREAMAVCLDPGTHWMVALCLAVYLSACLLLERKAAGHWNLSLNGWLIGLLVICAGRFIAGYAEAVREQRLLVLLTGIVFGKATALFIAKSRNTGAGVRVLVVVLALLAIAVMWQPPAETEFRYRGIQRWCGAWGNPNMYGLLMGTGVVLAAGLGFLPRKNTENTEREFSFFASFVFFRGRHLLLALAGVLCGYGLLKSYSRGAWLGTAVGLGFLWYQVFRCQVSGGRARHSVRAGLSAGNEGAHGVTRPTFLFSWLARNRWALAATGVSVLVLCFWMFRHTELPIARRVFSVANVNDFSWRNRVTVWQGNLRMMADNPVFGVGWGRVEKQFDEKYRAERLEGTNAVHLNDYLMLACSAGIPALICFLAYVGLTLTRNAKPGTRNFHSHVCVAVVVLLLIGFWFDGGLFKLPLAVVFWMMLELAGRNGEGRMMNDEASKPELSGDSARLLPLGGGWDSGLRWLAGLSSLAAVALTVLHLVTPRLAVSERTLAVARQCLVSKTERNDFDHLAAKPIWKAQRLSTLLDHVQLARYNRSLVNWQVSGELHREFVLNPVLDESAMNVLVWRRELWEYFYPRIRKEPTAEAAAGNVLARIGERIACNAATNSAPDLHRAWNQKSGSEVECRLLRIAALRAVGIPARAGTNGLCEFHNGTEWRQAAR